jgi:hypothetical protein
MHDSGRPRRNLRIPPEELAAGPAQQIPRIAEAAVMTLLARGHRLGIQHLARIPVAERDGLFIAGLR